MIKKLSDLSPADYNPREITESSFEGLKFSIEEFGDLSGIVFNKKTGNLVCGHQRVKALIEKYGDLKIKSFNDDHASIIANGETFPIRYVQWEITKEKAANLAANNQALQGFFTSDVNLLVEEIKLSIPELHNNLKLEEIIFDSVQHSTNLDDINKETHLSGLNFTIGEYVIKVPRETYSDWIEKLKIKHGFDDESVENEIKRRLKIAC